jgi:hypothetical protein
MPMLIGKDGATYPYQTLQDYGVSFCLDGSTFIQMPLSEFTIADQSSLTFITVLAYRNRFTEAEKVDIEMAALDDPSAAMTARKQAANVRVYLADLSTAKFIDLQDEATRAGAQALEAAGLLAKGRALEILDAPIEAKERL